jgi:NADH-quinone oxidoreductase subunit N
LCDVYDGATINVTLLFAAMPKIILFSVILKMFLFLFIDFTFLWSPLLLFSGVLSIFVGSISALYQKRLKRLFAYSAVSHTGFVLLGVAAASPDSAKSVIFYVIIYAALTVLLFSLLIFVITTQRNFPTYIAN